MLQRKALRSVRLRSESSMQTSSFLIASQLPCLDPMRSHKIQRAVIYAYVSKYVSKGGRHIVVRPCAHPVREATKRFAEQKTSVVNTPPPQEAAAKLRARLQQPSPRPRAVKERAARRASAQSSSLSSEWSLCSAKATSLALILMQPALLSQCSSTSVRNSSLLPRSSKPAHAP
eukprot:3643554-Pleurochrysis_carterae.AAC.8